MYRFKKSYLFIIALILLPSLLLAEQKYKSERNADVIEYTSRDGLPTNTINNVVQSNDGFIWISSPQGTVRFDGYEFSFVEKMVGIPDMQAVYNDAENDALYFASSQKMIVLKNGEYTIYDSTSGFHLNGGPGQIVSFIKKDSKGRIWIGSETPFIDSPFNGGLTYFKDGKFTVYDSTSFPLHNATDFIETPYGDIIFSSSGRNTQNGSEAYIALYKGNRFSLINGYQGIKLFRATSLSSFLGSAIDDDGNTWIAFQGISDYTQNRNKKGSGILMYDGNSFHQFPGLLHYIKPQSFVRSVFYHKELHKVFATLGSVSPGDFSSAYPGVLEFSKGSWIPSPIFKDIAPVKNMKSGEIIKDFRFNSVFFIKKSQALPTCLVLGIEGDVASSTNPTQYFTQIADKWVKHEAISGVPMLNLKKGLMIKTTKGVGFYHPEESKMLTEKDGLVSTKVGIPNFYVDRNQIIWMSYSYSAIPAYAETHRYGMNLWDGKRLRKYTKKDGLPSDITYNLLHDSQGRVWIGTAKGVAMVREFRNTNEEWVFKIKEIPQKNSQPYAATTLIETKKGEIYTWQNFVRPAYGEMEKANFFLGKFDGQNFIEIPSPFPPELSKKPYQLVNLREDRKGQLWLECHFAENKKDLTSVKTEILIYNGKEWYAPPESWEVPKDQLHFVGELNNGTYYLTVGHFYKFDGKRFIDLSDSVNVNADFTILKGASVVGTFTNIQVGERLYIRLRGRGLVVFDGIHLKFNTPRNGFVSTDIHDPIIDLRGNLFFASTMGAVMVSGDNFRIYHDDENIAAGGPNSVTIDGEGNFFKYYNGVGLYIDQQENVRINIKITNLSVNGKNYINNFPSDFSSSENSLLFNFSTLNFDDPSETTFEHMLEGYDKDWSRPSNLSFTEYQNLSPGNFIFRVRAKAANGIAMDETSFEFSIASPWWRTWWAYILYILVTFAILYLIRKIELRRQFKNARLKESELKAKAAKLQAKAAEAQSRVIQAENERKTKEMEEARALQFSLLPRDVPIYQNLQISAYMKTATEVGGDYYDFSFKNDETLNVAIGDATGHGMKAGTMVTAMKALFTSGSGAVEIEPFFASVNSGIKKMQLERVMMGFAMVNINKNEAKLINAGMPPVLLYKKKNGEVEEIKVHGMPLGAMENVKYIATSMSLASGDTLLLMSDGMPELQNDKGEMFGYERITAHFKQIAEKSPDEIIEDLKMAGTDWINDKDPDDDVTFVVIKVA